MFPSKGTMIFHNVAKFPEGLKIKLLSFMTQQDPNLSLKRINVLSVINYSINYSNNQLLSLAVLCSADEKTHLPLSQLQNAPS